MRKLLKFLVSRFFLLTVVLVSEIALIITFAILVSISQYGYYFLFAAWVLNLPCLIFVVNSKSSTAYKLGWMLIIALLPVFGILFYIAFANKRDTKRQRAKVKPYTEALRKYNKPKNILEEIKECDEDAYLHMNYIYNKGITTPHEKTYTKYFKIGQEAWPVLLQELKKAKHFIFIEFFIIEEGEFWNSILEVLKEKAKEGVEIRVIYDDFGSMTKVSYNYYKKLRKFGINAVLFQRYKWILDVKMNNRDHRKIIIIDGHTSFTGGMNLADEYVNITKRFGEWKDNMIMLKGDGTYGLTVLFLSMWDNYLKVKTHFKEYSFRTWGHECEMPEEEPKGYVQPYGDIPFDYESIGSNVYVNMIARAKRSVLISTPYLIPDENLMASMISAARSGVDVKIILPGIPDKKVVFQLSNAYAYELSKYGVEIYFYKPGFNHMKTVLVDEKFASIGTINFDLRSFHLNYENAIFVYNGNCIPDIKNDFDEMLSKCKKLKDPSKRKVSLGRKIIWGILKCLSPFF